MIIAKQCMKKKIPGQPSNGRQKENCESHIPYMFKLLKTADILN